MTRHFTALVNPIAGGGARRRWADLAPLLSGTVDLVETRGREHAIDAARRAAAAGRVVIAVGGDGLARDVATGVVAEDGTMAIVPAGRGNDLAHALGLPDDVQALATMLESGEVRRLDVLEANGVMVPGNVYAGLDSLSTMIINGNRWLPARLLYRLAPYIALARWRPATFTITVDEQAPLVERGHIVVIANSGWYGHGLNIVPSAAPDDARIDLLLVGAVPKYRLGKFLGDAQSGAHADWAEAITLQGSTITLSAGGAVPVCADGDELGELPITVQVRPGALRLLAPAL